MFGFYVRLGLIVEGLELEARDFLSSLLSLRAI